MKQIKEPESSSNTSVAGDRSLTLPDYLNQARQNPANYDRPAFDWLAFFKKINVRPKDLLKARKTAPEPAKATRLASGLTIDKTLEIVYALETALNNFKPGAEPYPSLSPAEIWVGQTPAGLEITLPTGTGEINRQRELTRLLYLLVTGQELAGMHPASQLDTLALQYPLTVNVLRQGWQDGYSSTRQLSGAFGWSLFRRENLPLTDEQIEAARASLAEKPKKEPAVRQLELPPAEIQPANRSGFPGVLALGSLLIGLVLIVAFLVFSAANPPETVQSKVTVSPTATIMPSPTAPTGLQNTRQADGVSLTRLNPAYLTQNEQKYLGPDSLAPGQAVRLNSQRNMRVVNAQWSLGQNVYLTLQDSGWEVWDTISGSRISRRELPDADQYAWVSWSPDGENFAAEGLDGKMRLGAGGRVLRTFPYITGLGYNPENNLFPLSWSPDSSILMLRNFDFFTQFQFWSFKGTPQQIMAPGNQPALDLKAEFGQENLNQAVWSWSGDSRYIAFYLCNGFNLVNIYDSQTLQKVGSLSLNWQSIPAGSAYVDQYNNVSNQGNFAWSPDGKYMALQRWVKGGAASAGENGYKRTLTVWEVPSFATAMGNSYPYTPDTFQIIKVDNPDSANMVEWSRNDRLLVDSRQVETVNNGPVVKSNYLQVYDLDPESGGSFNWTNTFSIPLPEFPYDVKSWWSPDGQRFLVSDDLGYLAIYELSGQKNPSKTFNIKRLSKTVDDQVDMAVPSPDGKWLATYSKASGPQLRDLKTGQLNSNFFFAISNGTVYYKWSPDSRHLALIYSRLDGTIYNPHTKTVARIWKFFKDNPPPALFKELLIPTEADFIPKVEWNITSAEPELLFEKNQNNVGIIRVNQAATLPLNQSDAPVSPTLTVTATATPGLRPTPTVQPDDLAISNAGSLSARSNSPNILAAPRAWSADWSFLVGPIDYVRDYGILKLAPDGSKDPPQKIFFQPSTEQKPEKANVVAVAVSPDGRMAALGFDNGLIQLYNTANGKLFRAYNAHQAAVTVLSFSPDSKSLASGSADHTVKVWETINWKNTAVLRGQYRQISFLEWLPDNKTLISGASDANSAVMWRVS